MREIGAQFGFRSPNAVRGHVFALARKGLLSRTTGGHRVWIPVVPKGHCVCCGRRLPAVKL